MAAIGELKIGDVVTVGERYVMADHPPFVGCGRTEPDEWTGRRFLVVGISGADALLASPDLIGADESDEQVIIHCRRITKT